ncbi:lactoylglutathione lyase [Caldovatus sediminis]|jgi:catechol 2,3-dioxygenase-like lactoylglutathione lyase family enzyme|uniref:Lactoylglutathione lyase n=1 Tax=Caldovatus sediminis TaxID=2041189 RepID=A0A8J2Z8E6_9PROT|nr:VOC family protein [Caldovatus sediminis]GGG18372.1 lactoylglutathione lyase [Caldovatus sediminis]
MAKIRHIAIATQDPDKAVEFYKSAFGFRELRKLDNERARGYFLTDGSINIALLKFKTDQLGKGLDYVGLHHFGVYTEDADGCVEKVLAMGGEPYVDEMELTPVDDGKYRRPDKFRGHEGIIFDVADKPWPGTEEYDRA